MRSSHCAGSYVITRKEGVLLLLNRRRCYLHEEKIHQERGGRGRAWLKVLDK